MVRVFGLTGGIGAGKSTVAERWRARGLWVIDADQLAREVVAPGTPGLADVVATFGKTVLASGGGLDRARLARLVFGDAEARRKLEAITHPRITETANARVQEADQARQPLVCYEAALIIERGRADLYRPLVVVCAPGEAQIARALRRGDKDEAQVRARLAAQLPNAEKRRVADFVIDNAGTLPALQQAADQVLDEVCSHFGIPKRHYPYPPS